MGRKRKKSILVGYLRVSSKQHQSVDSQKLNILEYCRKNDLKVDTWIQTEVSSRRDKKSRKLDELLETAKPGDTVIVSELSRLGRSVSEICRIIEKEFREEKRYLIVVKEGIRITTEKMSPVDKAVISLLSTLGELERDLIQERVINGLAAYKKRNPGKKLGRKKGELQHTELDEHRDKIIELLGMGLSARQIALRHLECKPANLQYWIRTRKIEVPEKL